MRLPTKHGATKRAVLVFALCAVASGCKWETVNASCANVPNPVLLGPVDRVKGHKAAEDAPTLADVSAEVAESRTTSSHDDGNYTVTTSNHTREGANKTSYAVMEATQGQKDQDVRLSSLYAGAWTMIPLAMVKTKDWVGISGDAVRASK